MQSDKSDTPSALHKAVATARILIAAMIIGLLLFLGVVLFFLPADFASRATEGAALLTYIAAGTGLMNLLLAATLPEKIAAMGAQRAIGQNDAGRQLAQAYFTKVLIAGAIIEGGALFNLVAHMLERRPLSLVVTGVLILAMAFLFPSIDRASQWIARQGHTPGGGSFDRLR